MLKYKFKDHPSIASEYVMFYPKTGPLDQATTQMTAVNAKLKEVDEKDKRAESAESITNNKLSSLETKIADVFKKLEV